jgi:type II secretory pathway pseudopilin PulG
MAALLTMLAVMSILLSAALPVWRHQMRREKEAELVFRGEQYARAIGLFNQKHRTFPPNIDVLVQQKFLRKKYKDPITGKDFRPIYAGGIPSRPGQGQAPRGVQRPQGDQTPDPQASSSLQPALQPAQGSGPRAGLMGVTSESEETSIRVYKGRTKYNQWQFVYAQASGRPGGPGARPMPGRPGGRPGRPGRPGSQGQSPGTGPGGLPSDPPPVTRPPSGPRPPGGAH